MNFLINDVLVEIIAHWDKKEELCKNCEPYWAALTTSQRREVRHDYEKENDE